MVTLIALPKNYSTANTKVAGLGETFIQQKFPRIQYKREANFAKYWL
jgi:hypothetical protein